MSRSGVEAMFLGEMISWVTSSFCLLALESEQGLKIFNARKEYCRDIISTIPTANKHDEFRPSFKSFLEDLVYSMDNYYSFCQSQRDARELNDYIKEVEGNITILTSKIIKIVMALNIHSDYKKDNFDLLMSPPRSNYPKINAMRNSGLGNWLHGVMEQIGVLSTAYNAERVLTVKEIKQILIHQHPYDTSFFYKDTSLKNCNHVAWGHRSFVLQQKDSLRKAENYNLLIREIIRGIAWLFFVQKNLKGLKIMSSGNGLIWVYGSTLGKALLDEAIKNIKWILNEKVRIPLNILFEGYILDGISYCKENKLDFADHMDFSLLTHLQATLMNDSGILGSGGDLAQIGVILKNIITIADNSLDMREKLREEQAVLIRDLLDTLKLRDYRYSESNTFITLSQALNECRVVEQDAAPVDFNRVTHHETSISTVDYYNFNYSYEQLPHYQEVVRLLETTDDLITTVDEVNQDLFYKKYGHCASLANIYMRFIQFYFEDISTRYALLFDTHPVFAFFIPSTWIAANALNLPREKLPDLRNLWFSINNVFKYLMSLPTIPDVIELELIVYVIKEKLWAFYLHNQEVPAILLGFESMWKVERHENGVNVYLNNYALSLTNSAIQLLIRGYIEKIETLERQLEEKEKESNETKEELDSVQKQLEMIKREVTTKDARIQEDNEKIKQITALMQLNSNPASEKETIAQQKLLNLEKENKKLIEESSHEITVVQSSHETEADKACAPSIGTSTASAEDNIQPKKSIRFSHIPSITIFSSNRSDKNSANLSTSKSEEQKNTSTRYKSINMSKIFK